jgi:predicted PurR-regulated permease PerM
MDILRNLFGSLTSGVIRLLVTVGILAAAYFFIVKPVLKSADNAIKTTNQSFEKSFGSNGAGLEDISKTIDSVNRQVQIQIERSFHTAKKHGNPKKLLQCVQHAEGNVHKIRRCTVKF